MSNPQPQAGRRAPPRAEPLQPDRPQSGDDADTRAEQKPAEEVGRDTAAKQKEQSDAALGNVRDGY